jgi:nitrogen regulatory protein PII
MENYRAKAAEISLKLARIGDLEMQLDEVQGLGERDEKYETNIYRKKDIEDLLDVIRKKLEVAEKELEQLMKEK